MENYILQQPLDKRRNFTKFRISAHNLAIETGRYTKPIKTPVNKRACFHCKQIENEFHVIFECPLYDEESNILEKKLESFSSISLHPCMENFLIIMSASHGYHEVGTAAGVHY